VPLFKEGANPHEQRDVPVVPLESADDRHEDGNGPPEPFEDDGYTPHLLDEDGRCIRHPDEPKPWCFECKEVARRAATAGASPPPSVLPITTVHGQDGNGRPTRRVSLTLPEHQLSLAPPASEEPDPGTARLDDLWAFHGGKA
jgi:hypothetical protein